MLTTSIDEREFSSVSYYKGDVIIQPFGSSDSDVDQAAKQKPRCNHVALFCNFGSGLF